MRPLLSIGQFSRLCQISVSALRFYADAGLLSPALIDPDSGYRYYSPEQLPTAERICALRAVEMPLDEIAALLAADETGAARLLERHEQRLYERFQTQRAALHAVGEMLRGQRDLPTLDVRERDWPAQTVLSVRGSADAADFWPFCQAAQAEMRAMLEMAGLAPAGPGFELYPEQEFLGGALAVEVCLPVDGLMAVSGRVRLSQLPAQRVACALHPGDWRSYGASYAALYTWIEAHNLRPAGPAYTLKLETGPVEIGCAVE